MIGPSTAPPIAEATGPKTIDFTKGYRDSTKGATLKALQQRRADIQGQVEQAMKPRDIDSMWQGGAQLASVIGGSIREGRAANAEAAGRARFAELLAGGLAPDEIGEAMGLDPETTQKYQEHDWDVQRDLTKHGYDVELATQRVKDERETAKINQGYDVTNQEDQQAHALELKAAGDKAAITLADHNASIDEKKAAQLVLDNIEKEKVKVKTDQDTASKLAETQRTADIERARLESEPAKIKLAMQPGADGSPPLLTAEEGKAQLDAYALKMRLASQSPASKQFDTDSAKENAEWVGTGRVASTANQAQLSKVLDQLDSFDKNPSLAGSFSRATGVGAPSGIITGILPDSANRALATGVDGAPDPVALRDNVRNVAQQSLKAVLGTQFAAVEGEGVMNRAYDTGATPKENANRIRLLQTKLAQVAKYNDARADWLANNPTMEGFTGPTPAEVQADFLAYTQSPEFTEAGGDTATPDTAAPTTAAAPSEEDIAETMRANNMTREQVLAEFARRQGGG